MFHSKKLKFARDAALLAELRFGTPFFFVATTSGWFKSRTYCLAVLVGRPSQRRTKKEKYDTGSLLHDEYCSVSCVVRRQRSMEC